MLDGDVSGAVRILASEDSISHPSEEVFKVLLSKHPEANKDSFYPPEPNCDQKPIDCVTPKEIFDAITSFPNGSSGGLDGLRPQHLKDLTGGAMGAIGLQLCQRLALLVDLMLRGNIPSTITPFLYGASLTALKKKDGGIRPIAVGNTLRRLAGKIVSRRVCEEMGILLRPSQLGYASKGGTEAAVHATRSYMDKATSVQVLLKIDFKNAFNCVYRDKLLLSVLNFLPLYYSFIWQMYRFPTFLGFGDFSLYSHRGIQQGDPLGPLLFCLVTKDLTSSIKSPLNCWYLDDGTIAGDTKSVQHDLAHIKESGSDIGLELNLSKCEAFVFGGDSDSRSKALSETKHFSPVIKFPKSEELSLLGSPLLSEGVPAAIDMKIATIKFLSSRLSLLHSHHALFILKNCFGAPRIIHLLRCAQTWPEKDKLSELDTILRLSLASITNTELDDSAWKQASLPVMKGGIGIRRAEELALPAYLASVYSAANLISELFPDFILEDVTKIPTQEWSNLTNLPLPLNKNYQKQWDIPLVNLSFENLLSLASVRERARLQVVSLRESGSWLNALPIPSLGNFLDDDSLRIPIALRLGSKVGCSYKCKCGVDTDHFGHHALSCNKSSGRYSRHAAVNDIIRRAFSSANIPAILEPPGLLREDGKRPDGMTLMPWKLGKALVWDVTCVDSLADSHIVASLKSAGSAAAEAEMKKHSKYKNLKDKFLFSPLGFETFGAWGPSSKQLILELGHRIGERTGEKRSTSYLRQRISIEIQRGNAASIFNSIPSNSGLDEIFNILPDKTPNCMLHRKPILYNNHISPDQASPDRPNPNCLTNSQFDPSYITNSARPMQYAISSSNSKSLSRRSCDNHFHRDYAIDERSREHCSNISLQNLGLIGMENIGNTCFMNSVIQCLSNTRWLLEYLRNDMYLSNVNSKMFDNKGTLINALAGVIKKLWSIDASDLMVTTVSLKSHIQMFAPRFIGHGQQDAQEFLRFLLDGLHHDVNRVAENPRQTSTGINRILSDNEEAQESWSRYIRVDNSAIIDNFVGQLKSTLTCSYCGYSSITFDPFWDLSLPIPNSTGQISLSQCLESFTSEEKLDGEEKPTCSQCKTKRCCLKSLSIHKFPKILVIHLKRFFSSGIFSGKLNTYIDFPLKGLDMNKYATENISISPYNLYAISNHSGTTYKGHYTSYCKHPYNGNWYDYNDSQISKLSPHCLISGDAYLLFYELETKDNTNGRQSAPAVPTRDESDQAIGEEPMEQSESTEAAPTDEPPPEALKTEEPVTTDEPAATSEKPATTEEPPPTVEPAPVQETSADVVATRRPQRNLLRPMNRPSNLQQMAPRTTSRRRNKRVSTVCC